MIPQILTQLGGGQNLMAMVKQAKTMLGALAGFDDESVTVVTHDDIEHKLARRDISHIRTVYFED